MRRGLALGLLGICAAAAAGFAAGAERRPRLAIIDPTPLTVRGAGFLVGERVTVTVTLRVRRTRSAVANDRGRFSVRFTGIGVENTCIDYVIRALGNRGTRAALKVTTVCTAPAETPPELQPADK